MIRIYLYNDLIETRLLYVFFHKCNRGKGCRVTPVEGTVNSAEDLSSRLAKNLPHAFQ